MAEPAFKPQVVERSYRGEVPWFFVGRNFSAVQALFDNGVIENQAWRVTDERKHFCIFYFRKEADAEKFVKSIGGYLI